MKSINLSRALVFFFVVFSASAFAQNTYQNAHEQGTTLGVSQNSPRDLANSLVVPDKPKVDKHEKKEEVDPKKLVSKKTNDKTFSGTLNDIGLDWTGASLGKPHGTTTAESKTAQSSESAEKDLKASRSAETSSEPQSKEQSSTTSKSDEKAAEKQAGKEKANTDSDR